MPAFSRNSFSPLACFIFPHIHVKLACFAGWNVFSFLYSVVPALGLTESIPVFPRAAMMKSHCGIRFILVTPHNDSSAIKPPLRPNRVWQVGTVRGEHKAGPATTGFTFKPVSMHGMVNILGLSLKVSFLKGKHVSHFNLTDCESRSYLHQTCWVPLE